MAKIVDTSLMVAVVFEYFVLYAIPLSNQEIYEPSEFPT